MAIATLFCTLLVSSAAYFTVASWNADIQEEYPSGSLACKMFNESVLDCSRRDLFVTPLIGKHNASSVDLSNNKIEWISKKAFTDQVQLISIDFSNNQLINITDSPFADLSFLVQLNLSVNRISFLAPTAFTGLHNLQVLDISVNVVKILPHEVFQDLKNLLYLDLMYNQLNAVPGLALSPLVILEALILLENPFTSATFGREFELLTHLNEFCFNSYSPLILTNKTFRHIPGSLRALVFAWNPFTNIKVGVFESLKNIEYLVAGSFRSGLQPLTVSSSVRTLILYVMQPILTRIFFMPLSNLNKSLTNLTLFIPYRLHTVKMEDFVFQWFPSLLNLRLFQASSDPIELSENTFNGLDQLESL